MARNIRNISVKAFNITYGVVVDGKFEQHTVTLDSESPRKAMKALSERHGVAPAQLVIISSEEVATEYRILDMVAALKMLADNGLAEVVTDKPEPQPKAADNAKPKASAKASK